MQYRPFCADFGPINLGMTHHFCEVLQELLVSPEHQKTKIVYYCPPSANDTIQTKNDITNAIYLLGSFLVLRLGNLLLYLLLTCFTCC